MYLFPSSLPQPLGQSCLREIGLSPATVSTTAPSEVGMIVMGVTDNGF